MILLDGLYCRELKDKGADAKTIDIYNNNIYISL